MKKIFVSLLATGAFLLVTVLSSSQAEAASQKIGVVFSESSEKYANTTHPGGTYLGQTVSPKVDYSSTYNKELKAFLLYQQQGFNIEKIYEKDLNNLEALSQYDAIVFAYTVMMNHQQRENVKIYVRNGGGALFAFQTARNESAKFPKIGQIDLSPLIYDVDSWVMEWDNLTEVFNARFIDDIVLGNSTVSNINTVHPIIQNATKELGKSKLNLTKSDQEWVEIIKPWQGSTATPILYFSNYDYTSKPQTMKKNEFGAAHAIAYGKGRVVQIGFKIFDYISIDAKADWQDNENGVAYTTTRGDNDAKVFMKHALNWTAEDHKGNTPRRYNLSLYSDGVQSYVSPSGQFVFYSTVTVKNNGNVPARGTLKVEILDTNGQVVGQGHERYIPGLAADATTDNADRKDVSTHYEKYQIFMPGNLAAGTYTIRTSFIEGRDDRKNVDEKFATIAEIKTLTRSKGSTKATIAAVPLFQDVTTSTSGYYDIKNLHALGIIKGNNGKFNPQGTLTRIQATEMVLRALGITASSSASMNASDLKPSDYGYAVLATGIRYGIISLENDKINAHQPMTRADMAHALVNGFKLQGISSNTFADVPTNHTYYKDIQALYALGITTGYADNTFKPSGTVTRQNFAQFVNRTLYANSK
ncbi:S-layer homology domain-containing protein [Lysinibacillus sp. NPDC048646]|uniref:S-layer homology domain-containing protein n=1 Tax=Lysinibacillus sp. NPDC048646 TaxID=3390574 RepID=UPI003D077E6C